MKRKSPNEQKRITVFAAALCFAVLLFVYSIMTFRDISTEKDQCLYLAGNETVKITHTVDSIVSRTGIMKALLQSHEGDVSWFDTAVYDIYETVKDETGVTLRNIAVAPGGIISKVYPKEGNENLIGFNYLDASLPGNEEAKYTYEHFEEDRLIISTPFELTQGGTGISARAPVILRYPGGGNRLWGLVSVTMDLDNLIEALKLDNITKMGLNYSLNYVDANDASHTIASSGNTGSDAAKTRFMVHNQTWELVVEPAVGWINPWHALPSLFMILIISLFAGMFANTLIQLKESNFKLMRISNTDRLTDCLNRRAYEDAISDLEKGNPGIDLAYVSIDVNGLKKINDSLGHLAGDELIRGTAQCLKEVLGPYGEVYRTGGDEFVALLSVEEEKIPDILKTLHEATSGWKGHIIESISISAGYVTRREFPNESLSYIAQLADVRMYEAKRSYYIDHGTGR